MRYAPIPEGRSQCQAQIVKRDGCTIVRDRHGATLWVRCGNLARRDEATCVAHADPAYRERVERKERERQARTQERERNRWTVERLARLPENRQLDLFVWADAYEQEWLNEIRAMVDARLDEEDLVYPGIDDDAAWKRYVDESDRRRLAAERRQRDMATNVRIRAERATVEHGMPSWGMLRVLVYERDGATCFVCGEHVEWEDYHLGHLQDRTMGGSDHPNNLVVMCAACNLYHKPLHESKEDAIEWARMTRAWHERQRARRAPDDLTERDALTRFMLLDEEQRTELLRRAYRWDEDIEAERRRLAARSSATDD